MSDLLRDLSKWQAVSCPDLANKLPSELFEAELAKKYSQLHDLLWKRILHLHGIIASLEKLDGFPFQYLYAPNEMSFWVLVTETFLDQSILHLHGLLEDNGKDALTLRRFRNLMANATWRDGILRDRFRSMLASARFDDSENLVAARISEIRNHRVAHQLVDLETGGLKGVMEGLTLEEIRALFNATHKLFALLSFGSGYVTLPGDMMPATVGGKPTKSCLDLVLDAVLKDSYFVSEPELRKEWWPDEREYIDAEQIRVMNEMRMRIGKPPA